MSLQNKLKIMKVPANVITTNQYTSGKEFMYLSSYKEYTGYYYTLYDKFFAGKEYSDNAPELIKIISSETNPLLTRPDTYVYGFLSKKKLNGIKFKSINFNPTNEDYEQGFQIRYFSKKVNVNPILIKEINKATFEKLQNDPFYQTLRTEYPFDVTEKYLNEVDKQMPGLKIYLKEDILNTSSDEDGL